MALVLGAVVLAADLTTKWLVQSTYWLHYYVVVDGFLTIQYATNEGIAFGWFHDNNSAWKAPTLGLLAVAAVVLVLYYLWTTPPEERLVMASLGILLGGILGNFLDRLDNQSVVDFIKVHWGSQFVWPTFNIADSAITCGVILIFATSLFGGSTSETGGEDDQGSEKESLATE